MPLSSDSSASLRHAALILFLIPLALVSFAVGKPGDDDETKKQTEPKGAGRNGDNTRAREVTAAFGS